MGEHHGPSPEAMAAATKMLREELGATGRFPDGKLNADDEGELHFAITRKGDQVILNFGKPVAWLAFPRATARRIATALLNAADE